MAASSEPLSAGSLLVQIRSLVDACFAAMQRYSHRCRTLPQQLAASAADMPPAAGVATDEAASVPAAGSDHEPACHELLSLEGMRCLLLQQVPTAVADLRRQHTESEDSEQRRQLAGLMLQELLLRLCIASYGAPLASLHISACTSLAAASTPPAMTRLLLA